MTKVFGATTRAAIESLDRFGKSEPAAAIDQIIRKAAKARAQSIHLEPRGTELAVRMRIDGFMRTYPSFSGHIARGVTDELKKRADISSLHPASRDGTFDIDIQKNTVTVQVSTLPTLYGDRLVITLHHKNNQPSLQSLGFWGKSLQEVQHMLAARKGLIVVAGNYASSTATITKSLVSLLEHPTLAIAHLSTDQSTTIAQHKKILLAMQTSPDIITIQGVTDSSGFTAAQYAARDHLVIVTMLANSPEAALAQITHYSEDIFDTSKHLLGIVFTKNQAILCNNCAKLLPRSQQTRMPKIGIAYAKAMSIPELSHTQFRVRSKNSCKTCGGSGTNGKTSLIQVQTSNLALKKYFVEKQPYTQIPNAIRSSTSITLEDDYIAKSAYGIIART